MQQYNSVLTINLDEDQIGAVKMIERLDAIKMYITQLNPQKIKEFYENKADFKKVRIEINEELKQIAHFLQKMSKSLDINDWVRVELDREIQDFYERNSVSNQISYMDKAEYLAKRWRLKGNNNREWENFSEADSSQLITSLGWTFDTIDDELTKEDLDTLKNEWNVKTSYNLKTMCLWRFCSILRKEISISNNLFKYIQQWNIKRREKITKDELMHIITK